MRFTRLISSFAAIGALTMLVVAGCSSDDKKTDATGGDDGGGAAGKTSTAKGGAAGAVTTTGTAGKTTTTTTTPTAGSAGTTTTTTTTTAGAGATSTGSGGSAGTATAATGGTATAGATSTGTGGTTSTASTLDDLIGAICNWEFKCCDAGEAKWELGPDITTAAACKARFVDLLRNNNSTANPYPAYGSIPSGNSPAINGLLISLAYEVNPTRVTENGAGITACISQWNAKACNAPADPNAKLTHCPATSYGVIDPCSLSNLVTPKQKAGDPCTDVASLKQGASNDVECVAGTSCISANTEDNNTPSPMCVTRGVANSSCAKDSECDFNFYCAAGKCTAKGSLGETCAFQAPTAPKPNALAAPCKPGLACNPDTLKCVANCTNGYVCTADTAANADRQCPVGSSCLPATVTGNDSTSFTICGATGAEGAKCNSLDDCQTNLYCDGSVCTAQKATGAACSTAIEGNCLPPNLYCKPTTATAVTGTCTLYTAAGQPCTQATGTTALKACSPADSAAGCVAKGDGTGAICSSTLLANGKQCNGDWDCSSERCEFANLAATFKTCIAGAALGEACDGLPESALLGQTRCAPGLFCNPATSKCIAQVGPGGSCESATTAGATDANLCKNASCNKNWWTTTAATVIMCTDAPVTPFNGGTGAVCDGK